MGENKYDKKDAAKETDTTPKNVSRAHHDAHEHAQRSDHPYDQNLVKGWNERQIQACLIHPQSPIRSRRVSCSADNRHR
jgi:hypothetical protein